jgi:PKD repeat protein
MKNVFTLLLIFFSFCAFAQQSCPPCPDRIILHDTAGCNSLELMPMQGDPQYTNANTILVRACQGSTMKYTLTPSAYGVSGPCYYPTMVIDTLQVQGGVVLNHTNSSYTIQWGYSNTGTVLIHFHIPGGSAGNAGCTGTMLILYNLLPNPIAAFTMSPNPACFNNPTNITFNSSASVGALSYFWDFGDGYTSNAANPTHPYTAAGTYTVCLTVSNASAGGGNGTTPAGGNCPSCIATVCQTLVINNLPGPDISCIATVCAGESGTYCTSASCSTYNWVITGGVITSANPSASPCITVLWGSGNPQGNIHLDVPGCPGFCSGGTDITVPIVPATGTISGSTTVCVGSTNAYSLPALPGTTYNWAISGGQTINGNNTNTPQINTTWNTIGTYTITCVYYDSALNCGGNASLVVNVLPELAISGPVKRCAGQNSNLNAHIVSPFTNVSCNWSISPAGATITAGNGTPTVSINWANAGNYLVTATPVSGGIVCGPVTYSVTVYPIPVISAINGADSICGGGTNVYSATSNMSGSFTWTITGGIGTPSNDSVSVVWNPTGPYSISVTQTSYANNCPSNAFTKTVYPYPSPIITGSTIVCADATVTYTITNIAAGFNWYVSPAQFGTVLSAPGANPVQIRWHGNNNPGGTNTVYLHYGRCGNDSIAITIHEPVAPTITETGSLCPGGVTLTSTGTGTFSWSHLEAPAVSSATNTLSGLNYPGHYTVQLITAAGCTVSATHFVANIGRPVASIYANAPIIYCNPTLPNMQLYAVSGIGYTYQWFKNGILIPAATADSLNVNSGLVPGLGSYNFTCVVTKNGCTDTSNVILISVITCPAPNGQGVGCSAGITVSNITGCNPFTLTPTVTNGLYIIPGSVTLANLEDGLMYTATNTTKTFTSIGIKSVRICAQVRLADSSFCGVCFDTTVLVKLAPNFLKNNNCGVISLSDLSNVATPATITSYSWSVSPVIGATFNNNAIPSPVLTVTQSGTYTISQTITSSGPNPCTATKTDTVIVNLPDADFNVSNSCVGTPVYLNNLVSAPVNYWNFGDATSSTISPTLHAYATTGIFTITHMVTDAAGCKDTVSKPVSIIAAPTCNIAVSGLTTFCSGDSVKLSACGGYTGYQWMKNGVAISGATSQAYYATLSGNYTFTANNPLGCMVNSDTVIVTVNPSPNSTMTFSGTTCEYDTYTVTVPSCAGCFYLWQVDGNFAQAGLSNSYAQTVGTLPFSLGSHWVKVSITGTNGCVKTDSVNLVFNPLPTVSITVTGNPPMLCSNNLYNFVASSNAVSPAWAWTLSGFNNVLSTTNTLNASVSGLYYVVVTDGLSGCSNSAAQMINSSPDLSLFPEGCDTLCQNANIFLPLASFNGNIAGYTITWYDNAPPYTNVVGSGASINLNSLALGAHNLSVIVVGPNGCIDTSNVYYIYIVPSTSSNTVASACGSYTWSVNGITYTTSGIYTSSALNANGCPQYDTLQLSINTSTGTNMTAIACTSYTWTVNGQTYTSSGTYTHSLYDPATGCTQYDTLQLIIQQNAIITQSASACGSYTWLVNGVTYTASGTYTYSTPIGTTGCMKIFILNLTIYTSTDSIQSVTACGSYTWPLNGQTYTASGTYTYTTLNTNGCVIYYILQLNITNGANTNVSATACNTYTWPVNGQTYTASGTYTYTFIDPTGCPQSITLTLIIHHEINLVQNEIACDSYTWPVNGVTYTQSGIYTYTSINSNGCLQTITLNLTINPTVVTTAYITACGSYTWPVNGVTYTMSCSYYVITQDSINGCAHVYVMCLTILPNTSSSETATACGSYTWPANGVTYTNTGTYTHTYLNAWGCTHTVTLQLTIFHGNSSTVSATACGSYLWPMNGQTYTSSGVYSYTMLSGANCPDTVYLHLTIEPGTTIQTAITACDSYTWNGITYTNSGTYTQTSMNASGCIITNVLTLTINTTTITTSYITACNSYTWPVTGQTYTMGCIYTYQTIGENGCPHLYVLCLTLYQNTSSTQNITACNSYIWTANAQTYTASGTYTYTYLNANGCVHTATLNLTINQSTASTANIVACATYTWPVNGLTYTVSGIYSYTGINTQGCPHVYTLNLTINPNTNTTQNVVACDSYTWPVNGQTYTVSGTYTYTSLNTYGCIKTQTLYLVIKYSSISVSYATACGSYTWTVNGLTYTASGMYTSVSINSQGCPHTSILQLTIKQNTSSSTTATACGSYTWGANAQTYTTSGVYTYTSLNAAGCTHTQTLTLTISPNTSSSSTVTACSSYTWPLNGQTYTQSGSYSYTTLNTMGCVHTHILQLSIYPESHVSDTIITCNYYTWPVNGTTYTASGIYTATSMSTYGCVQTNTLVLTINSTTVISHCDTTCSTYLWPINGVTYTASGVYTYTLIGANGCPQIYLLCLTVNTPSSSSQTATACESYTWNIDGITYTHSGIYTHTSTNSNGCLHTDSLLLTILPISMIDVYDTACGSYTWPISGGTYTTSGNYTWTIAGTATDPCPHIYTLHLTIHEAGNTIIYVNACEMYTWPVSGDTYTISGVYTYTSYNAVGCTDTQTLVLTLGTNTITSSTCDSACNQFLWPVNGVTYTQSGVYTYITTGSNGCPHIYILCITITHSTDTIINDTGIDTYTWNANGVTYTQSGQYTTTLVNSTNCDSVLILQLTIIHTPSVPNLAAKVFLSGPYNAGTGLMTDSLRTLNLIPLNEPYTQAPYNKASIGGGGGEFTTPAVLAITGNNAIVDWIHIELRSATNSNVIIANKNTLLQRDGDVVASDGVSPVQFPSLAPGNYFISIKHRNHLGIMTATPVGISNTTLSLNFTNASLHVVSSITSNTPAKQIGSLQLMWSGEDNINKNVKYNGSSNDKDPILITVGAGTPNNTVYGYRVEDVNMDGKVRYNNTDNDRAIILNSVGASTPNKVLSQHTPN